MIPALAIHTIVNYSAGFTFIYERRDRARRTWQPASHLSQILSLGRTLTLFHVSGIITHKTISKSRHTAPGAMGSGESTTRKVSFGVDDEDRVRILRGVKVMLVQLAFDKPC